MSSLTLALLIFRLCYALITTERLHKTIVALGACLGGIGTIIGASANVVIVDIARKAGYRITFWRDYGLPSTFRLSDPSLITRTYSEFTSANTPMPCTDATVPCRESV